MFGTYSWSKTALNAITVAFASDGESYGIKVNAACPSLTSTHPCRGHSFVWKDGHAGGFSVRSSAAAPYARPSGIRTDELAAVLFSSGSAGATKGVMLSHRNLISNTQSVNQLFQIGETDTIAGVLPFFHSFGFTCTLWFPLLHGANAAYHAQPLDAKALGELIQRSKATLLPARPHSVRHTSVSVQEQFPSLRYVMVGAEKLQPALAQALEGKFGLAMLEGYGATEMSPVISVNIPNREPSGVRQTGVPAGPVGQPVPRVAARVVDRETGKILKHCEEGLLA